jgi:hypothetical protein
LAWRAAANPHRGAFPQCHGSFFTGQLTAEQLEEWAENLEHREDVAFAPGEEELLDETLFCLANPSINFAITQESVSQLRRPLVEG